MTIMSLIRRDQDDPFSSLFNNGILTVSLPKTEQARKPSKTIEVK